MPRYYSGANPTTSFSDGLMAGYEFVDRIQARKRALELQELENQRAERRMQLAVGQDRRNAESHELGMKTGEFAFERAQKAAEQQDTVFRQGQDDRVFQLGERDRAMRVRDEVEGARRDLASGMLSGGQPFTSLGRIGVTGIQNRSIVPQKVSDSGQPKNVNDSAQPTGPVDLRVAQQERDNAPGFLERIAQNHKKLTTQAFWDEVADPTRSRDVNANSARMGLPTQELPQNVRRDPLKYADRYISERDSVSSNARASLDLTMSNAIREQLQTLDPNDRRNAAKIATLNQKLDTLATATVKSAATDAGITRAVKPDDPRVVPAIQSAAARSRAVQGIPTATANELRAATAMVSRLSNSKRLNEKQIAALTTLYKYGQIDSEQLANWSKYGMPIAPVPPKVTALGSGLGVVVTENGYSLIGLPQGGAGGQGGLSASEQRLRAQNALDYLGKQINSLVEAGELSDGSGPQHLNNLMQFLQREGTSVEIAPGQALASPDGNVNLAALGPGKLAELIAAYEAYDKGEEQPWVFKGGKTFSEYLPGGEQVIDLTGEFGQ